PAHVVEEAAVDLVDDLQLAREQQFERIHRPALERLRQPRVVGVGQGGHGQVPRLVPPEPGAGGQNTHHLGDGGGRVRVAELNGDLVGQRVPRVSKAPKAPQDIGQRARNQEVFLRKAQETAALGGVIRIEDARQVLYRDLAQHGTDEVAAAELAEVE